MPFKVLSLTKTEDTGDKFLGVGLADALIATDLSKIRRFVVRPTSSILQFEEQGIDPISAARRLDVGYILDGNIKKAGERSARYGSTFGCRAKFNRLGDLD